MKKILFNSKYGLEQAVLEGRKTMTRRIIKFGDEVENMPIGGVYDDEYQYAFFSDDNKNITTHAQPAYKVGDVVAIAQSYEKVYNDGYPVDSRYDPFRTAYSTSVLEKQKGWNNKMFVRADIMPRHIEITNIRVERLQSISDADCLLEGVKQIKSENVPQISETGKVYYTFCGVTGIWTTPRAAFAALIDKTSGKGTWNENPYVFVYNFVLID